MRTTGAVYAALQSRSATEVADRLVERLAAEVLKFRSNKSRLIPQAIEAFVADLLKADEAGAYAYRSMKRDDFTGERIGFRPFDAVVKAFVELGWLDHKPGKKFWTANGFAPETTPIDTGGRASEFRITDSLKAICAEHGVTAHHFSEPLPKCPLVLKRAKVAGHAERMDFGETEESRSLTEQMNELNQFLIGFDLSPYRFSGLVRIFNEGDTPSFRWNKGGRIYALGPLQYQTQRAEDRQFITIDGEPTVELDIRASNLTIYHGLMNAPFDSSRDPYEVEGFSRAAVKVWCMVTFGHDGHFNRWPSEPAEDFLKDHGEALPRVAAIRNAMLDKFPVLAEWGRSGHTWADLQFHESSAIYGAISKLMKHHNIPAYPVHDSLIVRAGDVEVAKEFIKTSYKDSFDVDVEVRLK
jgi:hypothetical protein